MHLREYLYENKLSLEEFGNIVGCSASAIHCIVQGRSSPRLDLALRIQEATKKTKKGKPQVTIYELVSPIKYPARRRHKHQKIEAHQDKSEHDTCIESNDKPHHITVEKNNESFAEFFQNNPVCDCDQESCL